MSTTDIDLSAVAAEVDQLSEEQIKEQLTAIRVRQKVQQKKQQDKGAQKAYQQKQNAKRNALKARAIALGLYDEINEKADELAKAKLAETAAVEADEQSAGDEEAA